MSIEALIDTLEQDTDARVAAVGEAARAEADRIRAEAELEQARRRLQHLDTHRRGLEEAIRIEIAEANHTARNEVLVARRDLIRRVMQATEEQLREADRHPAWLAGLPALVDEALRYLGAATGVVHCRPAVAEAVRDAVGDRAAVVADPHAEAGLQLVSTDGRVTVDARLVTRLDAVRPRLARRVLDVLEGAS